MGLSGRRRIRPTLSIMGRIDPYNPSSIESLYFVLPLHRLLVSLRTVFQVDDEAVFVKVYELPTLTMPKDVYFLSL